MHLYLCECMHAKLLQSCLTLRPYGPQPIRLLCLWDSQARILEWVAMPSSRGSSWPRNWIHISYDFCIAGRFFTTEPMGKLIYIYIVKREEWIISFIFRNKELLKLEGHLYLCVHIHGWFFDYSPDTLFHLSMNYLNDWSSIIGIGKYFMME